MRSGLVVSKPCLQTQRHEDGKTIELEPVEGPLSVAPDEGGNRLKGAGRLKEAGPPFHRLCQTRRYARPFHNLHKCVWQKYDA